MAFKRRGLGDKQNKGYFQVVQGAVARGSRHFEYVTEDSAAVFEAVGYITAADSEDAQITVDELAIGDLIWFWQVTTTDDEQTIEDDKASGVLELTVYRVSDNNGETVEVTETSLGEGAPAGPGSGDMLASVYDPTEVEDDAFDMENMAEGATKKILTQAERTKLAGVETGATADQTNAEIEAAYNAQVPAASQAEMETGTESAIRRVSPLRVQQAINSEIGVTIQPLDADLTALAALTAPATKLAGIETGATADQTPAEIETAYNAQVPAASQAEAEAGTETAIRRWSPLRVAQAPGNAIAVRGVPIDTSVGTPSDGSILVYRSAGSDWILEAKPAPGANPAIADITDITITAVADNEVLAFDTGTGEWINQTPAEAGLATAAQGALADSSLQDADIGVSVQAFDAELVAIAALAVTDGNIIVGNGTTWVAENGATARTSLGLTIGTNVQAWDADLDALAALTAPATKLAGIEAGATADQTAAEIETAYNAQVPAASQAEMEAGVEAGIRRMSPLRIAQAIAALGEAGGFPTINQITDVTITAVADNEVLAFDTGTGEWINQTAAEAGLATAAQGTLAGTALQPAAIGVTVQAFDADLTAIAALAVTDNNIIVGNGTTWVAESGATARASLGLTIGTNVQAWDADLDALAALTAPATKLAGIEAGATADQTNAEIEAAYNAQVAAASQAQMEAGIEAGILRMSPLRVRQAITAATINASFTGTFTVPNDSISYAEIQNVSATDRLLGRDTAAAGDIEELTVGGGLEFTGSGGIQRSALTGNVTATAGSNATTIATAAVTNAMLANMAESTVKGRAAGAGTGVPVDLSATQLQTILGLANLISDLEFIAVQDQNNSIDVTVLEHHIKTGSGWTGTYTLTFTGIPPAGLDFWVSNNSGYPQTIANGADSPLDSGLHNFSIPHDFAIRLSRGITSGKLQRVAIAPLIVGTAAILNAGSDIGDLAPLIDDGFGFGIIDPALIPGLSTEASNAEIVVGTAVNKFLSPRGAKYARGLFGYVNGTTTGVIDQAVHQGALVDVDDNQVLYNTWGAAVSGTSEQIYAEIENRGGSAITLTLSDGASETPGTPPAPGTATAAVLWATGVGVTSGALRAWLASDSIFRVYSAGSTATTGATPPTHTTGAVSDGTVVWTMVRAIGTIDGNQLSVTLLSGARGLIESVSNGGTAPNIRTKGFGVLSNFLTAGLTNIGSIFQNEKAAADADVAGDGQIWVKSDTPNNLYFTDDAGNDINLSRGFLPLAGGTVTGTISLGTGGSISDVGPISATGALTKATHSNRLVVTTGNVVIPNAAGDVGMNGMIRAGGTHTVTFNSLALTLASGDILTYYVESTTVLLRRKSVAADSPAMA